MVEAMDGKLLGPEDGQSSKNNPSESHGSSKVRQDNRYKQANMPAVGKMLDCRTGGCNLSDLPDAFCRNPWSHPEADLVPLRTQGL